MNEYFIYEYYYYIIKYLLSFENSEGLIKLLMT